MQKEEAGVFKYGDCVKVTNSEHECYGMYGWVGDPAYSTEGYETVHFMSARSQLGGRTVTHGLHPDWLEHAFWGEKLVADITLMLPHLYGQELIDLHTLVCNSSEYAGLWGFEGHSEWERTYIDATVRGMNEDILYRFQEPVEHLARRLDVMLKTNQQRHGTTLHMYDPKEENEDNA